MLDRHFVQSFLTTNKLAPQMSDDELRAAFSYAGWSKDEIDRAISIIRNDDPRITSITDARHSDILHSGVKLTSDDLSWLLGVDVVVDPDSVRAVSRRRGSEHPVLDVFFVLFGIVLASLCALALVWFLMTATGTA